MPRIRSARAVDADAVALVVAEAFGPARYETHLEETRGQVRAAPDE